MTQSGTEMTQSDTEMTQSDTEMTLSDTDTTQTDSDKAPFCQQFGRNVQNSLKQRHNDTWEFSQTFDI